MYQLYIDKKNNLLSDVKKVEERRNQAEKVYTFLVKDIE